MKFDVSRLKEMNDLDFEQVAVWPFEIKVVVSLFVAVVICGISYFAIISPKLPLLDAAEKKEAELKLQFEAKYRLAVNLTAYKQQLAKIEEDFSSMLKSLPTRNETPGLLDDITYVGTSAGLTFRLINWENEIPKEFYTELPIKIEVSGGYHNIGEFVSKVAGLPRIVTMHDFELKVEQEGLKLSLLAKTYRAANTKNEGDKK
ncbi:MAG: type 4a pilus biogenesis protein PilO [Pseudomonadota bacterium]|nr:type 4a pilus biogenesis protein PilO [Pseudomonadota bacterium]